MRADHILFLQSYVIYTNLFSFLKVVSNCTVMICAHFLIYNSLIKKWIPYQKDYFLFSASCFCHLSPESFLGNWVKKEDRIWFMTSNEKKWVRRTRSVLGSKLCAELLWDGRLTSPWHTRTHTPKGAVLWLWGMRLGEVTYSVSDNWWLGVLCRYPWKTEMLNIKSL